MKSLHKIIQVYNMKDTISCSIWNGYRKKRTPIWAESIRTEDTVYAYNETCFWSFEFPDRCDKIIFTRRCCI